MLYFCGSWSCRVGIPRSCSTVTPLAGGDACSDLSWFVCWLVGCRHVCTHFGYTSFWRRVESLLLWTVRRAGNVTYNSKVVLGCVQWVNYPRSINCVGGSILPRGEGGVHLPVCTVLLFCNVFHPFGVSPSTAAPDKNGQVKAKQKLSTTAVLQEP